MSVNVLFQVSSDMAANLLETSKRFMENPGERREEPERGEESPNCNETVTWCTHTHKQPYAKWKKI